MTASEIILVSAAPLDAHTAGLLRDYTSDEASYAVGEDAPATLRTWSQAARSGNRLVLADADLRAEANALANLLDDPSVRSAVLLAHNGAEENPSVIVRRGLVAGLADGPASNRRHAADDAPEDAGHEAPTAVANRPTAGILVVDPHELPAFAEALERTAAAARRADDPWLLALAALLEVTEVQAVEAAPFCASRLAMDLPARSEDDRRLRAAASRWDDPVTTAVLRPISRRLTRWAVRTGRSPQVLTAGGLAAGLLAALLVGLTGRAGLLLGALLLVSADVLLLADAELARYWRRPSTRGARSNRLAARAVEACVLLGLGFSAGMATWAWLAIAALGATATVLSMVASRSACTAAAHGHRPVRWLLVAAAMIVAAASSHSAAWGLWAALAGSVATALFILGAAQRKPRLPEFEATEASRFLVPPGSLVDAGLPVRLASAVVPFPSSVRAGLVMVVGLSGFIGLSALGWGVGSIFPLVAAVVLAAAFAAAFARPLAGERAWATAPAARAAEAVVYAGIAACLAPGARWAPALVAAAVVLFTPEIGDRWRYLHRPPAPWMPLVGLGFDGRALVLGLALLLGMGFGGSLVVGALVLAAWVGGLATNPWRAARR